MSKKVIFTSIGSVVLVALIGAGIWWLFNTGRLTYVASPGIGSGASKVCDNGIVEEYNSTAYINDNDVYTVNADQRQAIVTKIKSTDGFAKDPTCRAILFWYAVSTKDKASASEQYDGLVSLRKEGKYPDPALNESTSLRLYKTQVDSLEGGETSPFGG